MLLLSEMKWYLKVDFWLLCFSLWHSMLVYREAWQSERSRGAWDTRSSLLLCGRHGTLSDWL